MMYIDLQLCSDIFLYFPQHFYMKTAYSFENKDTECSLSIQ